MYRDLDPAKIVATATALQQRIGERFPNSNLSQLARELLIVAQEAAAVSAWLAKPHLPLRILAWSGMALILAVVAAAFLTAAASLHGSAGSLGVLDLLQGAEAAVNDAVLAGVGIYFLFGLELRRKRAKALQATHTLRSIAHIIDMHQLTKDPERTANPRAGTDTPSSPKRILTPFELTRYLDYCTEALAVVSKISALYVQRFDDPVTLSAVNDVEELTSGLSRKIWQKIMILDRRVSPPGDSKST